MDPSTLQQNQNALTKTFLAAFAGVVLAVPVVVVITTMIVKAQMGTFTNDVLAHYAPTSQASQSNQAMQTACLAPAEEESEGSQNSSTNTVAQSNSIVDSQWAWGGASNSYNQSNVNTTTHTKTVNKTTNITNTKVVTKVIRDSFNVASNNTVNSNNGNFSNNNSNNTNRSNNNNTVNSNNGNTTNSNNRSTVNSNNELEIDFDLEVVTNNNGGQGQGQQDRRRDD